MVSRFCGQERSTQSNLGSRCGVVGTSYLKDEHRYGQIQRERHFPVSCAAGQRRFYRWAVPTGGCNGGLRLHSRLDRTARRPCSWFELSSLHPVLQAEGVLINKQPCNQRLWSYAPCSCPL